jgi:hypothetical protein
MASWRNHRRPRATVLAWLLLATAVGLTACGAGEAPSGSPATRASERVASGQARTPAPDPTTEAETTPRATATAAVPPERTRTTRPAPPATTTTRPPTSPAAAEPAPTRTTRTTATRTAAPAPATTTVETTPAPAPSASTVATTGASQGLGTLGWLLLITLVAALIVAGVLVSRSQRRSAWDTEARALESETRTIAATRLPPVLQTSTTSRRSLVWPPVRADLADAQTRWNALTERASGDARRNWSLRVTVLIQELILAVDTENEALATGQDWTMLRRRVDQANRALTAILTAEPRPEAPPAAEPGPPALQT